VEAEAYRHAGLIHTTEPSGIQATSIAADRADSTRRQSKSCRPGIVRYDVWANEVWADRLGLRRVRNPIHSRRMTNHHAYQGDDDEQRQSNELDAPALTAALVVVRRLIE
jgi:hypothetical protein